MGAFEYKALDPRQRVKRGVVQADNPRQARSLIRDEGLIPIDVQSVRANRSRPSFYWGVRRDRAVLLRQMATLLSAGMTLEEVLTVLTDQSEQTGTRRALGEIRARILEGQSLSSAMAEQSHLFPRLYSASVAAAERSGQLEPVLVRLADYAQSQEAMSKGLGLALLYPAILGLISLAVVTALIGFVVPRIVGVFEQANQALPLLTRSLLALADFVAHYGVFMLIVMVATVAIGFFWLRQPESRLRLDRLLLRLPLIGRLVRAQQTALMARTLAILTGSTVPLVEALGVSASVLKNEGAKEDMLQAAQKVSEGVSLSKAMLPCAWISGVVKRLVNSGERSGELAQMLEQSAQIEERMLQSAQSIVLSVIQPMMILLVGLVVLYIVLAIMLPILNMSQLLGGV